MVVIWYLLCSEPVLHYCFFLLECNWEFLCSMLAPCFANLSACSLPLIPQCAGFHCRTTLPCSNMLYSLDQRLCSPCPASESNTDRESVRYSHQCIHVIVVRLSVWSISVYYSRLEIAEFPDCVHRSVP